MAGAAVYRVQPPVIQKRASVISILFNVGTVQVSGTALSVSVGQVAAQGNALLQSVVLSLGVSSVLQTPKVVVSAGFLINLIPAPIVPYVSYSSASAASAGDPTPQRPALTCPAPGAFVVPAPVFQFPRSPSISTSFPAGGVPMSIFAGIVTAVKAAQTLPSPLLSIFLFDVNAPTLPTIMANAPQYNNLYLGQASGLDNTGSLVLSSSYSGPQLQTDIQSWKATTDKNGAFKTVILMVTDAFPGGGQANYLNSSQAANATSSITNIVNQYALNGIIWDLEGGEGTTWNATTINSINASLRTTFGSNFVIAQSPRPFELHAGSTKRAFMQTHDLSDIQFYFGTDIGSDFANPANILPIESGSLDSEGMSQFVNGTDGGSVVDASKIAFSQYITGPGQNGATPAQYEAAWSTLVGQYPSLRGVSVWQSNVEQANGWTFASTFGPPMGLQ